MRQLSAMNAPLLIEKNSPLESYNTFGITAHAKHLLRVQNVQQLRLVAEEIQQNTPPFINGWLAWGGGSNIVLASPHISPCVLKMENKGIELVEETPSHWIVQAAAGERWHDVVCWCLHNGYNGLENMALIPGNVGAAPVQNIGAYGMELKDRFHSLDAFDMQTGTSFTLNTQQCRFDYRDSIFKHSPQDQDKSQHQGGLAGRAVITHVCLALPKAWKPHLQYAGLQRKLQEAGIAEPTAQQIFDMVVTIRQAKLPDPAVNGNAGSFFKNPIITAQQCDDLLKKEPDVVYYPLPDGTVKLAAGWLIDACGWRGKSMGNAGVYPQQALVLFNRYAETGTRATGEEVLSLAKAIQNSVQERFGVCLEMEPVVV